MYQGFIKKKVTVITLLYGDTVICSAILWLMDIWIHCLAITNKNAWTLMSMFFGAQVFIFVWVSLEFMLLEHKAAIWLGESCYCLIFSASLGIDTWWFFIFIYFLRLYASGRPSQETGGGWCDSRSPWKTFQEKIVSSVPLFQRKCPKIAEWVG